MRAQHKDAGNVLEVIPKEKFEGDLPATFVEHHAHWLDLSTSMIEIRPLDKPWEQSAENWCIHPVSGQYRLFKGRESLVDIRSPTWAMVSGRLECLEISKNLIITTSPMESPHSSPSPQLSIALPRYGLFFFVNQQGELESRDFKSMVYDENQCIGTLFGLVNRLVLRPKARIEEDLIPRRILIPFGKHHVEEDEYHVHVTIKVDEPKHGPVTCYTYRVDGELGCLTGIVSLKSRLFLAFLHALTSNVCRPDPLTGRTGLEEAISLIWSAGLRLVPWDPDLMKPLWELRSPQLRLAVTKLSDDRTDCDEEQSYDLLREAYLFPSEVAPPLPNKNSEPNHEPSEDEDVAYTIASAIQLWFSDAPIISDKLDWVEVWGDMLVRAGEPQLSYTYESFWPENNLPWIKREIYDILGRSEGGTRSFQLQFFLPTIRYFTAWGYSQPALIALLVAFAKQLRMPENYPRWDAYAPSDGYRPEGIHGYINKAYRSEREGPIFATDAENTAVSKLLEFWPSETVMVPTDLLNPDLYDVENLTERLQPLFSSCYRNFKLKEHFTRGPNEHRQPPLLNPAPSLRYIHEKPVDWQITLGRLLRERPAPQLPPCHQLPRRGHDQGAPAPNDVSTSSDIARLAQLFSSLRMNDAAPAFQHRYIADLDASASHFHTEASHTGTASGITRDLAIETLRNHYAQCKVNYKMALEILKGALGPKTIFEQSLDESRHWPRVTQYTLFRCLATTSPINPSESWKKSLVSLALLALELQRARRLLRLALKNFQEEFLKELDNEGCDGWVTTEHPDWLLMQVHLLSSDMVHMFAEPLFFHLSCKGTSSSVACRRT
jgi:hypothetical protein